MAPAFVTGPYATSSYSSVPRVPPFVPPSYASSSYVTGANAITSAAADCPSMRRALGIPEILRAVFSYLPHDALLAAMCACRYWLDAATDVHWRSVHVHYLNYVAWDRQQYYADKITAVCLRHVQARNAYVAAKYLRFPRVTSARFEADDDDSARDQRFLFPYIQPCLTLIAAHAFALDDTFFDLLHDCPHLREVAFSIAPARRFPDFNVVVGEHADKILHEPSLCELIANEASSTERVASAKSVLRLIADRPRIGRVHLGYGTEYLVTKQLVLACARLHGLERLYLSRPLSDPLAAEIAAMNPAPFWHLRRLILTTQSYSIPRLAPLASNLVSLHLSVRDAESGWFLPSLGTLTKLETLVVNVPATTQITGEAMMSLSALVNLRQFQLTFNKVHIPSLSPLTDTGFGDGELHAMLSGWSQLEELSLPFGTGLTDAALIAVGHSCPKLRTLTLPQVHEFSPIVFEPLGEPLFPQLQLLKLSRIVTGPSPDDSDDEFDAWWDIPRPDRTISKFMPIVSKHFPCLKSFDCPNPGGKENFLHRSWSAHARGDTDPDGRGPRSPARENPMFPGTDNWSTIYYDRSWLPLSGWYT